MLFTIKAINDLGHSERGTVKLRLYDETGRVVWSQQQEITIPPYGEKNYPVVLDLPGEPGGYTLVTMFRGLSNGMKNQISRRYLDVGTEENTYFEIGPKDE